MEFKRGSNLFSNSVSLISLWQRRGHSNGLASTTRILLVKLRRGVRQNVFGQLNIRAPNSAPRSINVESLEIAAAPRYWNSIDMGLLVYGLSYGRVT